METNGHGGCFQLVWMEHMRVTSWDRMKVSGGEGEGEEELGKVAVPRQGRRESAVSELSFIDALGQGERQGVRAESGHVDGREGQRRGQRRARVAACLGLLQRQTIEHTVDDRHAGLQLHVHQAC